MNRKAGPNTDGGVDAVAVEAAALAGRDCRAVTPRSIVVAVFVIPALASSLAYEPLAVRVGREIARVDGEVAAHVGVLTMQPFENAHDARTSRSE